jgi:polysaccharide export outer membrane protein
MQNRSAIGKIILFAAGFFALFLTISVSAQKDTGGTTIPVSDTDKKTAANYKIGGGDVIDVIVENNDALSRRAIRVSNQGTVQLAMLEGEVFVACQSETELSAMIREKYKKYLLSPRIIVAVKEFNSKPVAVIGAVNTPGRFQMQRPVRLLELMTLVNGPNPNAGKTIEIIHNPETTINCDQNPADGEKMEDITTLSLDETLKGNESANPLIRTGDIVRVLEAEQKQAYIHGNIRSPRAIDLKSPVTLTQAIIMSGGLAPGAQTDKIKISRHVAGSPVKNEILVNLKANNKENKEDIFLQPNDVVEIPGPSGSKKLFKDIVRTLVPLATRLPMQVIP